jgi:hypothetical protein
MSQNFCLLQQFSEDCPKEVIAQLPKIRPIGKYSLNRQKIAQSPKIRPIGKYSLNRQKIAQSPKNRPIGESSPNRPKFALSSKNSAHLVPLLPSPPLFRRYLNPLLRLAIYLIRISIRVCLFVQRKYDGRRKRKC